MFTIKIKDAKCPKNLVSYTKLLMLYGNYAKKIPNSYNTSANDAQDKIGL